MNYISRRYLPVVMLVLFTVTGAQSTPLERPADARNTQILYASHLFLTAEKSVFSENGSNELSLSITEASTIIDRYQFQAVGKQGVFDLETTSLYLSYSRALSSLIELKITLPCYYNWGGFMDRYIERFHKLFPGGGLRNGGREFGGDDEIHIRYQPGYGGPDITESFHGLGDPSLYLKFIALRDNPGISCTVGIKPGIGDMAFINSGTTDAGISATVDYTSGRYYIYAMSGCSYLLGEGPYDDSLGRVRDYIACAAAGGGVTLFTDFFLSLQFYIHNSLYTTGIAKIDQPTVINSWSIRWRAADSFNMQLCIDEDPFTYAAADIAFTLKCEYSF